MNILQKGSSGLDVQDWQVFLHRESFDSGNPDGDFGSATEQATKLFQAAHGLGTDGIVGPATVSVAMHLGFNPMAWPTNPDKNGPYWPPKPTGLQPLVTNAQREAVFGSYQYRADPHAGDPEHVQILDDWETQNIVEVTLPQLAAVAGSPSSHKVQFHRLAASQLTELWSAWEQADLLNRILSWDGSFDPRFVRGSTSLLSNHAFGSAFDINAGRNPFHRAPAVVGQKGSVRELVQIANSIGFYWGGDFSGPDGMHFEIAKLLF